jgi:hypothetical protein
MGSLASALRPFAADHDAAPRVYVDANLPVGVVEFMRHDLHWDVLFVLEHDDLRRASDRIHFHRAHDLGRTLITLDRDFFDDRAFPADLSPGVIVCAAPDERNLVRLLRYVDRALLRTSGAAVDLPLRGRKIALTPDVLRLA